MQTACPRPSASFVRRVVAVLAATAGSLSLGLAGVADAAPAQAAAGLGDAVIGVDGVRGSELIRSDNTKSRVRAMEAVGNAILVGGPFTEVADVSAGRRIVQPHLAAFDASTGAFIESFRPAVNGPVLDIVELSDGRVVIAGEFSAVNDRSAPGLAILDPTTGLVDESFWAGVTESMATVNSVAEHDGWLYAVGSFGTAISSGARVDVSNAARFRLTDGLADTTWKPRLQNGSGRGVAVDGARVYIGGYFLGVDGVVDTVGVVAVSPTTGALVPGWRQGVPDATQAIGARVQELMETRPEINDLDIVGGRIVYGSKHHVITVLDAATGAQVVSHLTSNGAQVVHVDSGRAYVGCHCSRSQAWIWELDRDGNLLSTPGSSLVGVAGPWGLATAPDGCLWTGGALGSGLDAAELRVAVYDVARICPTVGPGVPGAPIVGTAGLDDRTPPTAVDSAPVVSQSGATVRVAWSAAAQEQVRYEVARSGVVVGVSGALSLEDRRVPVGVHTWRVRAVDLAGNAGPWSPPSAPIEIAPARNIVASATIASTAPAEGFPLAHVTDGSTSTRFRSVDIDAHLRFDFGRMVPIDRIEVVKHDDALRSLQYWHLMYSEQAYADLSTDEARDQTFAVSTLPGAGHETALIEIPVDREARGLRLSYIRTTEFNTIADLAEFRVWSTPTVATPPAPAADITAPTPVRWGRAETIGGVPILRFGGADDDRGVTHLEIHREGRVVATVAGDVWAHGEAGLLTRDVAVVALDAAGNRSEMFGNPGVLVDTERPTIPTGVIATVEPGRVTLNWTASNDDVGVVGYRVFRDTDGDGDFVELAGSTTNEFADTRPVAGATHRYYLKAVDAAGNSSWRTGYRSVSIAADGGAPDTTRPGRATDVVGAAADGANELSWAAAEDDTGVVLYRVYRDVDGDGVFTEIGTTSTTSFSDTDVAAGVVYRYYLRAEDAAGNLGWRTGYRTVTTR